MRRASLRMSARSFFTFMQGIELPLSGRLGGRESLLAGCGNVSGGGVNRHPEFDSNSPCCRGISNALSRGDCEPSDVQRHIAFRLVLFWRCILSVFRIRLRAGRVGESTVADVVTPDLALSATSSICMLAVSKGNLFEDFMVTFELTIVAFEQSWGVYERYLKVYSIEKLCLQLTHVYACNPAFAKKARMRTWRNCTPKCICFAISDLIYIEQRLPNRQGRTLYQSHHVRIIYQCFSSRTRLLYSI